MLDVYKLAYQISPLILTGGAASSTPGSMMPFLAFSDSAMFAAILGAQGAVSGSLDDTFGSFQVLQGGTLVQNSIGKYPFANQFVAANAIIREPLNLSVIWQTPMRGAGAWAIKMATMQALKATLDNHNNAGGTYTYVTPSYIYTNLVMTALTDNSRPDISLPQNAWRFDFEAPLISLQQAQSALSQFMNSLTNGLSTDGSWSGTGATIGAPASAPQSVAGPISLVPSASVPGLTAGTPGIGSVLPAGQVSGGTVTGLNL